MGILIKCLLPTALVAVTLSHKECFRSLQQRLKAELLISSARNYHVIPVGSRDLSTPNLTSSLVPRPHPLARRNVSRREARAGWARDYLTSAIASSPGPAQKLSDFWVGRGDEANSQQHQHYTISLGTVPVRYGDYGRLGTRLSGTAVNLNKERKVSGNSV